MIRRWRIRRAEADIQRCLGEIRVWQDYNRQIKDHDGSLAWEIDHGLTVWRTRLERAESRLKKLELT